MCWNHYRGNFHFNLGSKKKLKLSSELTTVKEQIQQHETGERILKDNIKTLEMALSKSKINLATEQKKGFMSSQDLESTRYESEKTDEALKTAQEDMRDLVQTISQRDEQLLTLQNKIDSKEAIDRIIRHDLRGGLIGYASLPDTILDDINITEEQRTILKLLRDSGKRMLELVDSSMIIYQIEEGTYDNTPESINIYNVIDSILSNLRNTIEKNQNEVEIFSMDETNKDNQSFYVYGNEFLLYWTFNNLLLNAIEASPKGSLITITLSKDVNCTIAVRNHGEVPKDIRDIFFNKMVTSGKKFGTGLGTYSAMLMTKAQGGNIELSCSEPGVTTIYINLPKPPTT